MNTKLILWITGILIGTVTAAVLWYVMFVSETALPPPPQPVTTLPAGGSITPVSPRSSLATSSPEAGTIVLTAQDGTVTARDFIHNDVTIPDDSNDGNYLLAGNLGYCLSDPQKCQAASATDFSVYYISASQLFVIDLTREPLGQARLAMEQFMMTTLGLTEQQMCNLNYLVSVTKYVSEQYTGKNLGFSFCPGATVLPK